MSVGLTVFQYSAILICPFSVRGLILAVAGAVWVWNRSYVRKHNRQAAALHSDMVKMHSEIFVVGAVEQGEEQGVSWLGLAPAQCSVQEWCRSVVRSKLLCWRTRFGLTPCPGISRSWMSGSLPQYSRLEISIWTQILVLVNILQANAKLFGFLQIWHEFSKNKIPACR